MDAEKLAVSGPALSSPGRRLKHLRKQLNLRQKNFAEELQISQSTLSQIENDYYRPSFESLNRLTHLFDVNCNWLIAGTGHPFRQKQLGSDHSDGIGLIDSRLMAQHGQASLESSFAPRLSQFTLPGFTANPDRKIFELKGQHMEPYLLDGDFLVADLYEGDPQYLLNQVLIFYHEGQLMISRMTEFRVEGEILCFRSDNPSSPELEIPRKEISKLWVCKGLISNRIPDSKSFIDQRIGQMESKLESLSKEFNKLKPGH